MSQETLATRKSLEEWRKEIDSLDGELLRLLNLRAGIACQIGKVKVARGLPAYDGSRERQVLAQICEQNSGPFSAESVSRIFRRIIFETRRIGTQAMELESKKSGQEQTNGHQHGSRRI